MNIVVIVQARMSSSRLPGKVMKPLAGMPALYRQIERIRRSSQADHIVVATSIMPDDDEIVRLCEHYGIDVFRGHLLDLLDRHYQCARAFHADAVVKIPSDCPLIDPAIIDRTIQYFREHYESVDFVSNLHPASYPDGNDVEVMRFSALETAWVNAKKMLEREHTTPYIWDSGLFRCANIAWETGKDYSMSHRWTLDYVEDYECIRSVYDELYDTNPCFTIDDILHLLEAKPDIASFNAEYVGVNWYRQHLDELQTIDSTQTRPIAA
jgi:spore coat polysaccharide biosynthesis protein SpsF